MKQHRFHLSREVREKLGTFDLFAMRRADGDTEEEKGCDMEDRSMEAAVMDHTQGDGLYAVSLSHIGCVRTSNQDAVILDPPIFGVADGMGGHQGGETASRMCRDGVVSLLKPREQDLDTLVNAVRIVNRRIHLTASEDPKLLGMGTTLTCLWFGKERVHIAHVGDSRLYLLREGALRQVTDDHSMVMEMVRAGIITREQARSHPMRNVITRAVGTERSLEVDALSDSRKKGDVWLICSDGLYGQVTEDALQKAMEMDDLEAAARTLMEAALEAGGPDNISLILLRDEGAEDE